MRIKGLQLFKGNRLPHKYTYKELADLVAADEKQVQVAVPYIGLGNNTVAYFGMNENNPDAITVKYQGHIIMELHLDGCVKLDTAGMKGRPVRARMSAALLGIGFNVVTVRNKWKIYCVSDGRYLDYYDGMWVCPWT